MQRTIAAKRDSFNEENEDLHLSELQKTGEKFCNVSTLEKAASSQSSQSSNESESENDSDECIVLQEEEAKRFQKTMPVDPTSAALFRSSEIMEEKKYDSASDKMHESEDDDPGEENFYDGENVKSRSNSSDSLQEFPVIEKNQPCNEFVSDMIIEKSESCSESESSSKNHEEPPKSVMMPDQLFKKVEEFKSKMASGNENKEKKDSKEIDAKNEYNKEKGVGQKHGEEPMIAEKKVIMENDHEKKAGKIDDISMEQLQGNEIIVEKHQEKQDIKENPELPSVQKDAKLTNSLTEIVRSQSMNHRQSRDIKSDKACAKCSVF